MSKNSINFLGWAILALAAAFIGCSSNEPAQPPQPVPQIPQAPAPVPVPEPVQPAVAVPTPPPATPLLPIGEGGEEAPAPATGGKGSGSIDKPLPGAPTTGDELIGNYNCSVDSKALKVGPFKAPPFGCKIFKAGDGSLKVASTSDGAGSMKGNIKDSTASGFFIIGKYEMGGNSLAIKARMQRKGEAKFVGKGRGRVNDDKANQMDYTLTMTKQ